jgi:PAS domain S-box-containing protein
MTNEMFDQQLLLSRRRLEELWQRADKLQNPPAELTSQPDQFPEQQHELLRESLEQFSFSLEELQVLVEELQVQNEELTNSRIALESEHQRYKELFDLVPDGYLVTTLEGVILEANQTAAQLLNVPQKYLVGKPLVVFVAAEERQKFSYQLSQLQRGKSIKNWEVKIQSRQDGCFTAAFTVTPVHNPQEQVVNLHWRFFELFPTHNQRIGERESTTEHQKGRSLFPSVLRPIKSYCQEQILPSNQYVEISSQQFAIAAQQAGRVLDDILSSTPAGFLVTDRTGKYIYVNRTAAQCLGFSQSDFIGKTWRQLELPTEIMERFDTQREAVFRTGESLTDETSFTTVQGVKDYEYTINPISDIDSDIEAVIVTVQDITKHKQAAVEASIALAKEKEMSALKSQSVFVVSQELRNLLHNIFAYIELIEIDTNQGVNNKKVNYFQRIQLNLKRINQLLDDLLWIGKLEAGEVRLNPAILDLSKFCGELIKELQQGADFKHRITFSIDGQYSSVCMDRKLLRYILINLLLNAIKYSPKGSEVKLDVVCHEKDAIFSIQDFGIGIPQQDQELMFKPFHRGSNVEAVTGKGLGLAIVKHCVDLQAGTISVESEEGIGTTFTVKLPLNLREVTKNFRL